ncbi:MAG: alpha/beta fold hydrolase [Thermoplasmata archaeon]
MAATEYVVAEMAAPRAERATAAGSSSRSEAGRPKVDPFAEFTDKLWKAWDLAVHPPKILVGQTPSDVIYAEDKMRVLRYRPLPGVGGNDRPPILLVYALINKPYIMDLEPGHSVVESLLQRGLDVYLIDWGIPNNRDKNLRIHDYVNGYVDRAVDAVRETSGADRLHILGYCMGGSFAAMYAALHPEKVRSLALMAAGLDFDTRSSFLNIWSHAPGFDPWKIARTYELIPASFFNDAFGILDPLRTNYLKFKDLLGRIDEPAFVGNFLRMEKWTNDGIPMAGPTYAEFIDKGYQRNLLVKGEWTLDGDDRAIDLAALTMPVATIVGLKDNLVPPESTERILDHVGSKDVTRFQLPSGHIGLSVSRAAHKELWPRFAEWVLAHNDRRAPRRAPKSSRSKHPRRARPRGATT